jgi:Fe-S-cluster-containing dehydrogenase component
MARNGLLIQHEWCTGCHACEVACKQEHKYPVGTSGIKVYEMEATVADKVYVDFMPVVTRFCDLCADRVKKGDAPACVKHCQATCMTYGPVATLAKEQEKQPHSALWEPK